MMRGSVSLSLPTPEERCKVLRLHFDGRPGARAPGTCREVHHLHHVAPAGSDLNVGRLEAAGDGVVQPAEGLRHGRDRAVGRCDRANEKKRCERD